MREWSWCEILKSTSKYLRPVPVLRPDFPCNCAVVLRYLRTTKSEDDKRCSAISLQANGKKLIFVSFATIPIFYLFYIPFIYLGRRIGLNKGNNALISAILALGIGLLIANAIHTQLLPVIRKAVQNYRTGKVK